ncbi:MAG: hypothetical protein ABIH22_02795, partial [Candidatus Margulisiibacteriota bacterium]
MGTVVRPIEITSRFFSPKKWKRMQSHLRKGKPRTFAQGSVKILGNKKDAQTHVRIGRILAQAESIRTESKEPRRHFNGLKLLKDQELVLPMPLADITSCELNGETVPHLFVFTQQGVRQINEEGVFLL